MKQRNQQAYLNSEVNLQTNERKKPNTPFTQYGDLFYQNPSNFMEITKPSEQFETQLWLKSNQQIKNNSSSNLIHNLVTQTQLIQTTINIFHEKYDILKILKENQQCQIVQCRNIITQEYVVAKICILHNFKFGVDSEIKVCQTLQYYPHSKLMKLLEMFTDKDTHIFIYEYMEGGTLFEYMQHKQLKLDESEIRIIFKQLLKALNHLDSLNIIHRDLKLDNIMFKVRGDIKSLKLIDYGFSTLLSDVQGLESRCGTPGYVAPEIYEKSHAYNQLCDIYSLGAIIHILATGKRIYSSKFTSKEICELNKQNKYQISINKKCTLLYDIITQMLQNVSNRPSAQKCLFHPYFIKLSELNNSEQINQQIYKLQFPQFKNPFQSFQ
ncbi:unnamed protein product [Paramecium sonneborni]|uniref:Protein kinase domain-containing protein n=1 Tax=Paramecium sonneborni TaxID=65129 RepID=A0A8S1L517_9CILI|nr:unnamed protein product [Paramecium sonneborni]